LLTRSLISARSCLKTWMRDCRRFRSRTPTN